MNLQATEEQIRNLPYRLWEEAGNPEGRLDDFWIQAQQDLASEPGMKEAAANAAVLRRRARRDGAHIATLLATDTRYLMGHRLRRRRDWTRRTI